MAFFSAEELLKMGFAHVGRNVRISSRASIYHPERIILNDGCRVDDFCVLSGSVTLARGVHIAAHSLVDGADEGVHFDEFSVLAYGCYVFAVSDDYSGESLTSLTVPSKYKQKLIRGEIVFGKYSIAGTGTIVFPGASLGEGAAVGAGSILTKPADPWTIYMGRPARKVRQRSKKMLALAEQFRSESAAE